MGFYENRILPVMINYVCGHPGVAAQRELLMPEARGRILEIGAGTGLNLPYYRPEQVELLWALEPSPGMQRVFTKKAREAPFEIKPLALGGEEIELETNSVDTVVLTYTLCSIPGWEKALDEMRRVLKPSGRLLFSEHGLSPEISVARWQNRLTPLWKIFAGGCHLNRPISDYIAARGFELTNLEKAYLPGVPRFAGYNFRGTARIR